MNRPWFDPENGVMLFNDYVAEMPSFKKITEDSVVTDTEVGEQAEKVVSLLKELERMLSPEAKEVATDALCELAVLNALQLKVLERV